MTGLPWEIEAWRLRRQGRRVERAADGAVVLIDALPIIDARSKVAAGEVRRTFPSLTAAVAL